MSRFAAECDWEQFHSPKKLAMALAGESGELPDILRWLTPVESTAVMGDPVQSARVREEMADVFAYLLRMADVLDLDVEQALADKIEVNRCKYPAHLARGRAGKYRQLRG
ncbi:nucleotide pyrophosphohydrolase [Streptomyces sp. NPDC056390]|uniref:nucleotide pyrophosphohydrolase n=1 Tax=Streptomyces sp. NPDC056390 TaxID=3345806 RepID=UPI0035DEB836